MSETSLPPTSRSLPIALIRARETVMAPIRDMLAETGLTEQQWRVLRVLSESNSLVATELAERASLHQPSLTRILKALEERNFIARSLDEADRRRQVVVLTSSGLAVIESNTVQAKRIADAIEAALGPAKLDILLDLLGELRNVSLEDVPGPEGSSHR